MATPTYIPLATVTLAAASLGVTFTSISQDYGDLIIVFNGTFGGFASPTLQFNGDSGSNYSYVYMQKAGTGTNSSSGTVTNVGMNSANYDTNIGTTIFEIMDYSATDKHKTVLAGDRTSREFNGVTAYASRWANNSAITTISVNTSNSFQAGSTFKLFGIHGGVV